MNNPLKGADAGRNALVGFGGLFLALVAYGVGIIIWVSQTTTSLSDRLKFLEDQQTLSRAIEDKLNTAREETNVHFATMDGKLTDLDSKVSAMFDYIQQDSAPPPPASGGSQSTGAGNFLAMPSGGR